MGWSPWRELAEHPDILVHRCRLDEGLGWWCPTDRVILLEERLDPVSARCVLAHELGHAVLGHEACHHFGDSRWLAQRIEAAADDWAGLRLVPVAELVRAAAACAGEPRETAHHLEVTPAVLSRRLGRLLPDERRALASAGRHFARAA
jgi:Zn-dependent peptidase ImmA (M78 family)